MGDLRTLRAFIAEAIGDVDSQTHVRVDAELVEASVRAARDWLAQPEICVLVLSGSADALRREAVK